MTGTQLATLIRKYTGTTSTTYSDSDILVDANNAKNEIAQAIAKRNEQLFMITSTEDLVASSVTAREYPVPDDMLSHIHTIEGAFDPDQPTVFVPILPYPGGLQRLIRNINGITEAKITDAFNNEEPKYFLTRRGIYILSGTIKALTDGLKLRYRLLPADLANLTGTTGLEIDPTTTSFGMPVNFHELWARRVSIIFKSSRPKPIKLSPLEGQYDIDLEKALASISQDDYGAEEFGSLPDDDSPEVLGANA